VRNDALEVVGGDLPELGPLGQVKHQVGVAAGVDRAVGVRQGREAEPRGLARARVVDPDVGSSEVELTCGPQGG
jgi:hypothetical protein